MLSVTRHFVPSAKDTSINSETDTGNPVPTTVNSVPPKIFRFELGVTLVTVTITVFYWFGEIGIKPPSSLSSTSHSPATGSSDSSQVISVSEIVVV